MRTSDVVRHRKRSSHNGLKIKGSCFWVTEKLGVSAVKVTDVQ